jgi:YbbR domain-containing protein
MKNAVQWAARNVGLFLLSVVLALLVWIVAAEESNPTIEEPYDVLIPVNFVDVPEGMLFYGQTSTEVTVTLRTTQSVWDALSPEDLEAVVNLNGLEAGEHRLPVAVSVNRNPAIVREVDPAAITLQLEPLATAQVPVRARVDGSPALGYSARLPEVTPLTVTVRGPASYVAQVAQAIATVPIEDGRADVEGEFNLAPHDVEGGDVPYVSLSLDRAAVRVPIEQRRGYRDLAVTARLEGEVAPGYRISNITVDPPLVTVSGRQEAVDAIPGYLETIPIEIEGEWRSVELQVPLVLTQGVTLTGMDTPLVTVRITIVAEEGSVTVEREVRLQGWSPGITATVAPTASQIILRGPLPVLERLQPDDVMVVIDLFGLTPGSYSLEPRVIVVPQDVEAESVVPASVQVEIRSAPTPTPGR